MITANAYPSSVDANIFEDYWQRLDALLPLLEEEAEQGEHLTHMTDRAMLALRQAGMFALLMPQEVGGAELTHVEAMQIVERIAWAHASAGWCVLVNNVVAVTMALFISDEGVNQIFGDNPNVMVAGNGVPRGYARPVEGGYMIKGKWAYGSGIQHAEWIHSGCFVMRDGAMSKLANGQPEIIIAHHPRESVELKGNWDVLGLRATGSYDYALKDAEELFVPEHLCYSFSSMNTKRGKLQGSLGLIGYPAWGHTSWALGVTRRMLDELVIYAREKSDAFGKLCDSTTFKFQFAQAEAKFRAARALALQCWQELADSFAANKPATVEQIALIRLSLRHVHDVASEVVTFAYRSARGTSLHDGSMLQRCYRDIHAGTQHILCADQIFEECGRALLGCYEPDAKWSAFSIEG